jgi:hypothetical protein
VHAGAAAAGYMWAAISLGSMLSAFAFRERALRLAPRLLVGCSFIAMGLSVALWPLVHDLAGALALVTLTGALEGPSLVALIAVRQRVTPTHLRGQILATVASLNLAAMALGAALAGPVHELLGTTATVLCFGVLTLASGLSALLGGGEGGAAGPDCLTAELVEVVLDGRGVDVRRIRAAGARGEAPGARGEAHQARGVAARYPATRQRARRREHEQRAEEVGDEPRHGEQRGAEEPERAVDRGAARFAALLHGERHALDRRATLDAQQLEAEHGDADQQREREQPADRAGDLDEHEHLEHGQADEEEQEQHSLSLRALRER